MPVAQIGTIDNIIKLDPDRFVYKVTLNTREELVIKGEWFTNQTDEKVQSVVWGSKMMKNVNDKAVNVKPLNALELIELKAKGKTILKDKSGTLLTSPRDTGIFDQANVQWFKMPFVPGLSDGDLEGKKLGATYSLYDKFSNDRFWSQLGKVLAVDIFIGNQDRFTFDGSWQNKGNVMLRTTATGQSVIGLDTFDPNSSNSNLVSTGGFKELNILKNDSERIKYIDAVVKSVGAYLGTHLNSNLKSEAEDMFKGKQYYLAQGIKDGVSELRIYLTNKIKQYQPAQAAQAHQQPNPGQRPQLQRNPAQRNLHAQQHGAPQPNAANPVAQAQGKNVPRGILERMEYLGWR